TPPDAPLLSESKIRTRTQNPSSDELGFLLCALRAPRATSSPDRTPAGLWRFQIAVYESVPD
ncbi:hypothetical protein, partial [Chromobacterium vaccinii]|uniref:hypothetical protein n=1 Tax=Chromobacterium vaccinii TaxID=1108595 RepID=UPI001E3706B8